MAYNEYKDYNDDMDLDESSLYEDSTLYEPDTFRERLDDSSMEDDETLADEAVDSNPNTTLEDDFGETINTDSNPHIEDQLEDDSLNQEAESDYDQNDSDNHESLMEKAKDKVNEWTGNDK